VVASCGAPRIHAELGDRLWREGGPQAGGAVDALGGAGRLSSPAPPPAGLDPARPKAAPAPDLCQRQFSPPQLNRLWHADDTELPTDQGTLYLVAVVDGCSRLAVGHAMGAHADAALAISAVELVVWRRGVVDEG